MSPEEPGCAMNTAAQRDTAANVDSRAGDAQGIQLANAVQPHAVLIVLHPYDLRILQASVNIRELSGRSAEELIGQKVSSLLENQQSGELANGLTTLPEAGGPVYLL